jgi:hypothetical protein
MPSIFRFAYSLAVAMLFILFVVFGTRTFFDEPTDGFGPAFEDERQDYFRNVLITAGVLGVAAIAAGAALFRRVDALPLGLVLGGIGALLYGWEEWSRGPEETGSGVMFMVVSVGLVLVLAGGYWFLGRREEKPGDAARPTTG